MQHIWGSTVLQFSIGVPDIVAHSGLSWQPRINKWWILQIRTLCATTTRPNTVLTLHQLLNSNPCTERCGAPWCSKTQGLHSNVQFRRCMISTWSHELITNLDVAMICCWLNIHNNSAHLMVLIALSTMRQESFHWTHQFLLNTSSLRVFMWHKTKTLNVFCSSDAILMDTYIIPCKYL